MSEERIQKFHSYDVYSDLKIEVELLKRDVSFIKTLFDKMDKVIEKIESQHEILFDKTAMVVEDKTRHIKDDILSIHDKIEYTELSINKRIESIETLLQKKTETVNGNLDTHIEDDNLFAGRINKLIYTVTGGVLLLIWILTNLDDIKKFLN